MARKFPEPVKFRPKNPKKYRGDVTEIWSRSSWERALMIWLDKHPACLAWGSEEVIVPYVSPVDGKPHRYFIDFVVTMKGKDGLPKKFLIEVKPESQTRPPVVGNKKSRTILTEAMTYAVNQAKWDAADKYAKERGMQFVVFTEYDLGIATRKNG